jgi:hypothetical protein
VASKEIKIAVGVGTKVIMKAARVVSRVVVAVGIPNSKIRTQTVVGVFGVASKTILGTINDSLFARRRCAWWVAIRQRVAAGRIPHLKSTRP